MAWLRLLTGGGAPQGVRARGGQVRAHPRVVGGGAKVDICYELQMSLHYELQIYNLAYAYAYAVKLCTNDNGNNTNY